MSDKTFQLDIVSPEKTLYTGQVAAVKLPAHEGYLGVMSFHAPLLCLVQAGEVTLQLEDGSEEHMAVSAGFFEVSENHAILLADSAETAGEIDLGRARQSVERARERLKQGVGGDVDHDRAADALVRSINRVKIAERYS